MSDQSKRYIDFMANGKLFPTWIMKNFKDYNLPEIVQKEGVDPCSVKTKLELRKYQKFVGRYLDYKMPYKNILIYHGLGSGKTTTAINVYNILYNYTPAWNVFILLPAALEDAPWKEDLKTWLEKDEYKERYANIIFVHYDSPFADKDFMNAIRQADSSKKSLFVIEECHNFMRNVYSNINSKSGRRAQVIYDYIIEDKKDNVDTRVLCLSATPAINEPFELALLFNLLRDRIFPKSQSEFEHMYVSDTGDGKIISPKNKNMFQRRILGLVSYYYGATPDRYATKSVHYIDMPMTKYQQDIYKFFEDYEDAMEKKMRMLGGDGSQLYRSYTRQACNFVFPMISQKITGEGRPRPGKFRISDIEVRKIEQKMSEKEKKGDGKGKVNKYINKEKYNAAIKMYIDGLTKYLSDIYSKDKANNYTIFDDLKVYREKYGFKYRKFHKHEKKKSGLYNALYESSPKMTACIFYIHQSKGPVVFYSNYVHMEGIEIFKIYLSFFGYGKEQYGEFHGDISKDERNRMKNIFNSPENVNGKIMKIFILSPSGTEGISLFNVRQIHILEPYWTEVRINQIIGRGIRQCSHKLLPMNERHVDVFRYKVTRDGKITTDQHIEQLAKKKEILIDSFEQALREAAIDCHLFKNHNMLENKYKCFQFNEKSLFNKHIGPAFKQDPLDDVKIDNGLNSLNSIVKKIKVMKIKGVVKLGENEFGSVNDYWYYSKSGVVYDLDLHYPVGRVIKDDNDLPEKLDKDTFIISQVIKIPST